MNYLKVILFWCIKIGIKAVYVTINFKANWGIKHSHLSLFKPNNELK